MSADAMLEQALAQLELMIELEPAVRVERLRALRASAPALAARVEGWLAADANDGGLLDEGLVAIAPHALRSLAAERPDPQPARQPGDTIGAWRLLEPLGSGGMGEVWLATRNDGQFEQQVAIKLLKRGMDSDGVLQRFRRERQILARLEHPGIARLLDGGMTTAGLPYFAMECIRGTAITLFANARGLDARARVRLVVDLCTAVDFAHRRLVVHRDLKPGNVLVSEDGILKVLDFGIAKVLDDAREGGATETGTRVMSPAYASPEQLLGEPVAIATDVYAIGLVLFELLSGGLPHGRSSGSPAKVCSEVLRDATEAPSVARRHHLAEQGGESTGLDVDRELDLITLQSLRREPEQRYASAAALGDDLRRWLEQRPIRARPSSIGYRVRKFVSRNRLASAIAVLALAVVLTALSVSIAQRQAALLSAEEARVAARRAELSKQFLVSLFDRADAFSSANHGERTVIELLEATPARLLKELADEPQVQAELLLEVGGGLRVAGRLDSAHAVYRQALDAIARMPVADPILHAKALLYIGYAGNDLGRNDEARAYLLQAQALYLAAGDDRRRELISVKTSLARNANMRGDLAEALRLRKDILVERRQLSGERDPDYAMDLMNLSTSLLALGRAVEAEQELSRAHRLLDELLGAQHPRTLTVLRALAAVQLEQGRLAEARASAEDTLAGIAGNAAATTSLGPLANSVLARVALYEYRLGDARRHGQLAIEGEQSTTARGAALRNLGRVQIAQGQFVDATRTLQQSLEAYAGASATSRHSLWAAFLLADARRAERTDPTSISALRDAFVALSASEGEHGVEQFEAALMMGRAEREAGMLDHALALHEQALAATRAHGVLGEVGLALAHAECALDLQRRAAAGDAESAMQAAVAALPYFERHARDDPRRTALAALLRQTGAMGEQRSR